MRVRVCYVHRTAKNKRATQRVREKFYRALIIIKTQEFCWRPFEFVVVGMMMTAKNCQNE